MWLKTWTLHYNPISRVTEGFNFKYFRKNHDLKATTKKVTDSCATQCTESCRGRGAYLCDRLNTGRVGTKAAACDHDARNQVIMRRSAHLWPTLEHVFTHHCKTSRPAVQVA